MLKGYASGACSIKCKFLIGKIEVSNGALDGSAQAPAARPWILYTTNYLHALSCVSSMVR